MYLPIEFTSVADFKRKYKALQVAFGERFLIQGSGYFPVNTQGDLVGSKFSTKEFTDKAAFQIRNNELYLSWSSWGIIQTAKVKDLNFRFCFWVQNV